MKLVELGWERRKGKTEYQGEGEGDVFLEKETERKFERELKRERIGVVEEED